MKVSLIAAAGLLCMVSSVSAQNLPSYYPPEYQEIIEGSKSESELLIYNGLSPEVWAKVLPGFKALYPHINVQTLDLGGEMFERYNTERATNTRTADLIIGTTGWKTFVEAGNLLEYVSPEADHLPDWAKPTTGIYTMSADPLLLVYNKFIIPPETAPNSLEDLATLIEERPELASKITTYTVHDTYGKSLTYAYGNMNPDHWRILGELGANVKHERSAGPMFEKLSTGEYAAGYFLTTSTVFTRLLDPRKASIIGWNFVTDGTPLIMRTVGIPNNSKSVNSAKLMIDYLVSVEGQKGIGSAGLTVYRPEVQKSDVAGETYASVAAAIGDEAKIIPVGYDLPYLDSPTFDEDMRKAYPNAEQ